MLRSGLSLLLLGTAGAVCAEPAMPAADVPIETKLAPLKQEEAPLNRARESLPECEKGCTTPTEAVALAFSLEDGQSRAGRFLLDVRGGGQSLAGNLGQLFFLNSQAAFAELGTLTIAFEADVLDALLTRARVCDGGPSSEDRIAVRGCRRQGLSDVNMFTMMQRLSGRRIVVDGDVILQWIDAAGGAPSPVANKRGENEAGYYQPWVWVYDADQITFVYED